MMTCTSASLRVALMGLLGSLLFAATPALAQTPIAADYTTSVSGNFTSGDWEVKYPVTVFVDTDGGINGGTNEIMKELISRSL